MPNARYLSGDFYWPSDINFSCRSNGLVWIGEYDKVVRIKYPYVFINYGTLLRSFRYVFEKWTALRYTSRTKILSKSQSVENCMEEVLIDLQAWFPCPNCLCLLERTSSIPITWLL